jgi:asparagine synthase (glutamine-hydrolysing)/putative beta-lactam synthetase
MSGFVGWIDFERDISAEEATLRGMAQTMRHRGPDGEGVWLSTNAGFGHCRLATSDGDRDLQPFVLETDQGSLALCYSGHIDNIAELRSEVLGAAAHLRSSSVAEVLLQGFLLFGAELVQRLRGMFAFAVWDGRRRALTLARDRLGVKPLYYFEYPGGVAFASEPKGVLAHPRFVAAMNLSALPILLQPRLTLSGETPLRGLSEVPRAHVVRFAREGSRSHCYWRLVSAPHEHSFEKTALHVRELLTEIVGQQLLTDVSLGAMLSGGVDSTSIAALAAKRLRETGGDRVLDTFCIQFASDAAHFVPTELRPEVDAPYAAEAAELMGSRHRTLTAATEELFDAIPATREARDLPGWGQFDASIYLLFKQMRRHAKVALTGEAADEFFGGYPYFFKPELMARAHFPWLGDGLRLSEYLAPDIKARIDPSGDERARYAQLLAEVPRLPGEELGEARMREVLYLGMAGPLAVILDRKDRMSSALGLEVRVPFCDHRLVEYVWNVPWSMKARGGVKGLLKVAMADLLPRGTLSRQKSAYPQIQNPQYDQALVQEAKRIVSDKSAPSASLFDTARLTGLIVELAGMKAGGQEAKAFPGGSNPAHLLIHLVELDTWLRRHNVSISG